MRPLRSALLGHLGCSISRSTGAFRMPAHFSRAFRSAFGKPPRDLPDHCAPSGLTAIGAGAASSRRWRTSACPPAFLEWPHRIGVSMRVSIGDTRLFFDVEGVKFVPDGSVLRERPTILLLHGGPGFDHSSYKPAYSTLSALGQVVYLDHRGHGRSDPAPAAQMNLAQLADDCGAFCRALEIEKPVVYGLSFGGFVAQALAIRHPDLSPKIILDSTVPKIRLDMAYDAFERLGGKEMRGMAERFWTDPGDPIARDAYMAKCLPALFAHRAGSGRHPARDPEARTRRRLLRHRRRRSSFRLPRGSRQEQRQIPRPVRQARPDHAAKRPRAFKDILPPEQLRFVSFDDSGHGIFRDFPRSGLRGNRELHSVLKGKRHVGDWISGVSSAPCGRPMKRSRELRAWRRGCRRARLLQCRCLDDRAGRARARRARGSCRGPRLDDRGRQSSARRSHPSISFARAISATRSAMRSFTPTAPRSPRNCAIWWCGARSTARGGRPSTCSVPERSRRTVRWTSNISASSIPSKPSANARCRPSRIWTMCSAGSSASTARSTPSSSWTPTARARPRSSRRPAGPRARRWARSTGCPSR